MSATERNVVRLQGALHRVTRALKNGRENLVRAIVDGFGLPEETVLKMPSVVELDKALGKPIGDVTRRELIEMLVGKDDLVRLDFILEQLVEGTPEDIFLDYDEACSCIGALRKLIGDD